jgi:hypothetical protein
MNRTDILKTILNNKSGITDKSAMVYVASLASLAKALDFKDEKLFTTKPKEIITYLDTLTPSRSKSILSGLIAFVTNKKVIEAYKKKMVEVSATVRTDDEKQEKTDKQEENWMSWDDVMKLYKELEDEATPLFKKDKLNAQHMKTLQNYVILSMYVLIPPRRIADYTNFKTKDINKKEDNYYDDESHELVFNSYKTAKNYGTQKVDCPVVLREVFQKWFPLSQKYSDYLLFNSYGSHLAQPQLTKMINNIFGKKISASMLRHIYVSDVVLKNMPKMDDLKQVASDMGHSMGEQMLYKKF